MHPSAATYFSSSEKARKNSPVETQESQEEYESKKFLGILKIENLIWAPCEQQKRFRALFRFPEGISASFKVRGRPTLAGRESKKKLLENLQTLIYVP